MYSSPKKYFLFCLLLCNSILLSAQTTKGGQPIIISGDALGDLEGKYSKIEKYYDNTVPLKEIYYPIQKVEVLLDAPVMVPRLSTQKIDYKFTAGDTIRLEVYSIRAKDRSKPQATDKPRGRKFKYAAFIEAPTAIRDAKYSAHQFITDLPILSTGVHSLEIDNSWKVANRHFYVQLTRRTEVIPEVYHFVKEEIPGEKSIPDMQVIDTLLTQLIDTTVSVAAVLDLENPSTISVAFPTRNLTLHPTIGADTFVDTVFSHWTYWVGVGQETIDAYDQLAGTIPQGLVPPGVSIPLAAKTLGKLLLLPVSRVNEVSELRKSSSSSSPSGNIYEEVFYFTNKNSVNRYPVRLIAIAVYSVRDHSIQKEATIQTTWKKVKAE